MHLSVRACACIRAHIFLHKCGVGVRAQARTPAPYTHIKIYTDKICIIDVYVVHVSVYVHTYAHMKSTHVQIKKMRLHLQTDIYMCRHLCV